MTQPPADFLRTLGELPDGGEVLTDPADMAPFIADRADWAPVGSPLAVVRARSAADVQAVVRAAIATGTAVVPRGGGSGLSGGANASDGCVVLSLDLMTEVLEVNALERLAVVQPGLTGDALRERVARDSLWYPPDPASSAIASLGGNVATNAGGLCCVKYGVTRDYVIALEVVTGLGDIVRVGHRTAKGVAGYDLVGLYTGSEGTLGIITEITVKLRPLPETGVTVAGYFPDLVSAGRAIREVAAAGVTPAALELVDRHCLRAVDAWQGTSLASDAEAMLLARLDDPTEAAAALADRVAAAFTAGGASRTDRATDPDRAAALFSARRLSYPALERLGTVLTEDICVPKAAVPEALSRIHAISEARGVPIANIAHAGDGNLHPLIIVDEADQSIEERAQGAFHDILNVAIELGGTVTGEHGIGTEKMAGLENEQAPEVLDLQRAIKRALDPHGILNPGKVIAL